MRMTIESVVEKHAYLLGLASEVDKTIVLFANQQTIYNKLSSAIPQRILAKTTKSKFFEHMVDVWNILHILLPLVKFGRVEEHDVGQSALPTMWGLGHTSTERRNGVGF
jgi:hypothetical protein